MGPAVAANLMAAGHDGGEALGPSVRGVYRNEEGARHRLAREDVEDAGESNARAELTNGAIEGAVPLLYIGADGVMIEGQRDLQDHLVRRLVHGRRVAPIGYPSPPAVRDRSGRSAAW